MVDMSKFIAARSDQLNADDLIDAPRTVTITKVTAAPDAAEQPVSIHYEGDQGKPFKPCKTMRRILVGVWGKDASKYVGRSMTLYRDGTVAFGGLQVGGIRISHMSDISEDKTVALLVTRGRKAPFKIKPLVMQRAPAATSEDGAARWANGYIAKLADFTTLEALAAFANEKSGKLAELATARPELHEKVAEALATRTADLKGGSSFDDEGEFTEADDEPAEPTSSSMAEQIGLDNEHPGKAIADEIIAEINDPANNAIMDVARVLTAHQLDIGAMLDEDAVRVEVAADKRRNEIRKEQAKAKATEAAE